MSVLITGAGGMVGSHLVECLYKNGEKVVGTYYKPTTDITEINYAAELIECDVRYSANVYDVIEKFRPKQIYHLAAQSYPTVSWDQPQATIDTNINGTVNVFEAIVRVKKLDRNYDPVVIVACSSAEYGNSLIHYDKPVNEDAPLLPLHPYGVSKVGQDLLAYQYYMCYGIKCIRARIFNTTGPRKVNDVCADFTSRVIMMEKYGNNNQLRVGNIETYRAITDVRDLVAALILLASKGIPGEAYNISGQNVYQIKEIIEMIKKNTDVKFSLVVDEHLLRPSDEKIIVGDSSKLIRDTGWEQTITLEKTIYDMMEYWRNTL